MRLNLIRDALYIRIVYDVLHVTIDGFAKTLSPAAGKAVTY